MTSPTPRVPSGRKRTHPVYQFFSFNEVREESKCLIGSCNRNVPGNHSGNLAKHVKHNHKEQHELLKKELSAKDSPKPKKAKLALLNGVQMTASNLQLQCLRMVSEHGHAFRLLDDDAFQCIIRPMIDAMPATERVVISSRTIPPLIPTHAEKVHNIIRDELKGKFICLKVDATTKNNRSFLGINVQYVVGQEIVVRTLAVTEMFTKHTGANIKFEVLDVLSRYGIQVQDIFSVTCDNGANMLKAAELLREAQEQVVEDLEEDTMLPHFEVLSDDGAINLQSVRCAAHTLQLAVEDAVKDAPAIKQLLDRARKLSRNLRTPNMARLIKREKLPLPVLDVSTRWGSAYDMLKSLAHLRPFITELSNSEPVEGDLSADEWTLLNQALEALEPARTATTALQEKQLLLGDFYALWLKCKLKLQQMGTDLARRLIHRMEQRERNRTNRYGEEKLPPLFEYPGFLAAIFLDPRFFSLLSADQVQNAKEHLRQIWLRLEQKQSPPPEEEDNNEPEGEVQVLENSDSEDELTELLAVSNTQRYQAARQGHKDVSPILDQYYSTTKQLKKSANILAYWDSQRLISPELHQLASVVLAIPATQVSVERLFSALRYVLNPLRYNLSHKNVDDIMVIHCNADIVQGITSTEPQDSPGQVERSSSAMSGASTSSLQLPLLADDSG